MDQDSSSSFLFPPSRSICVFPQRWRRRIEFFSLRHRHPPPQVGFTLLGSAQKRPFLFLLLIQTDLPAKRFFLVEWVGIVPLLRQRTTTAAVVVATLKEREKEEEKLLGHRISSFPRALVCPLAPPPSRQRRRLLFSHIWDFPSSFSLRVMRLAAPVLFLLFPPFLSLPLV